MRGIRLHSSSDSWTRGAGDCGSDDANTLSRGVIAGTGAWPKIHRAQANPYILCAFSLTLLRCRATIPPSCCFRPRAISQIARAATGGSNMQYLPGWTVQCINQACAARGHWLRAHLSGPNAGLEFCPSCGCSLQAVPPPIGPRLRMRPRSLAARPPLRPRPR